MTQQVIVGLKVKLEAGVYNSRSGLNEDSSSTCMELTAQIASITASFLSIRSLLLNPEGPTEGRCGLHNNARSSPLGNRIKIQKKAYVNCNYLSKPECTGCPNPTLQYTSVFSNEFSSIKNTMPFLYSHQTGHMPKSLKLFRKNSKVKLLLSK